MKPIKNILNLSLGEFLHELYGSQGEKVFYSELDIIKFIKNITDEYDSELIYLLQEDLSKYCEDVITFEYKGNEYVFSELSVNGDLSEINYNIEKEIKRMSDIWDEYKYDFSRYLTQFVYYKIKDDNLKILNFSGVWRLTNFATTVAILYDEKIKDEVKEDLRAKYKEINRKHLNGSDRTITFIDLFKKEYQRDEIQSKFSQWLIRERYLNHSNEIICDYTKFARLYYLLREEGITNPIPNKTNVMRTYFGNFGVEVVESYDPENDSQQVVRKTVTGESAETHEMLGMTTKEKDTLLNIFKPN